MCKRVKYAGVVFVALAAAAQFIRPERANPPTVAGRTIRAQAETTNELASVLQRACRDCHSNETVWPRYARIAPVSWLMAYGVREGRKAVNFSEWAGYTPDRRQILLALSCQDASEGRMPGAYTMIRPETRLSTRDIDTICSAARHDGRTAGGSH